MWWEGSLDPNCAWADMGDYTVFVDSGEVGHTSRDGRLSEPVDVSSKEYILIPKELL